MSLCREFRDILKVYQVRMNAGRKNSSLTPKKAAKPAENFNSDACRLCGINFKISVGNFGGNNKYISTENLFKIPQRAGVDKIPLADLLKIHLDIEVHPQDGKSSRVCAKCALKIRNASTLIKFITTALNRQNTDEESQGEQRLKRMNIVSPQRNIKKPRAYSSPSTSKQSSLPRQNPARLPPAKRPLLFSERIEPNTPAAKRESASTSKQLTSLHLSQENSSCLQGERSLLLVSPDTCIDHAAPTVLSESEIFPLNIVADDTIEKEDEIEKKATQKDELQVDVILNFPSGKRHKQAPKNVANIVKNFALGNFGTAVSLIFKCEELQPFLHGQVKSSISNELKEYCRSDNSLLKHTSPAELAAFSNKLVCHEVSVMCPLWNSAIRGAAGKGTKTKPEKAANVLALCSSALAKFRNERMSALAYRISVVLLHSGAKSQDFTRLNHLGICMSHAATISKQKQMAKEHDSLVCTWKNDLEAAKKCELLLMEVQEKQVPAPMTIGDDDMEIDCYDLRRPVLQGYDNFSEENYETCKEIIGSSCGTPAALEVANSSASDSFKTLPRYR